MDSNCEYAQVLEERDASGALIASYVYGNDLICQIRGEDTKYYLYDGQGSTRALVNQTGAVTDTYNYDAFGLILDKTGSTPNDYLYTGEQYDPNIGFYYLRARYMNPAVGRFVTMDAYQGSLYDPVSLHKYVYANANPITYADPGGKFSISECISTITVQAAIFAIRHPVVMWVVGFAMNTLLPVEVHDAMISTGLPGITGLGTVGKAEARVLRLFKNQRLTRYLYDNYRRLFGKLVKATGDDFNEFAKRFLFKNDAKREVTTGKHIVDFVWKNYVIELKTSVNDVDRSQLKEFSEYARVSSKQLVYLFLKKPEAGIERAIQKVGGIVYYLFENEQ